MRHADDPCGCDAVAFADDVVDGHANVGEGAEEVR